jgi:Kef-type K+ transport system membrane component KefB
VTDEVVAQVLGSLAILLGVAHLLGHAFVQMRQPRLIGEILTGVLLGPFVLGRVAPLASARLFGTASDAEDPIKTTLGFIYWLGLLLLMFISGSEARQVLGSENRRATGWLLSVGTPLPFFVALVIGSFLPLGSLAGSASSESAVLLVIAIAVAVTSIPVISRIFYDLGILHTRFASLVLGAAILEDIILWGALALATALASTAQLGGDVTGGFATHIGRTVAYLLVSFLLLPHLLGRMHGSRWNVVERTSPVGYAMLVLFAYAAVAASLEVSTVFAAFLAGFGFVGGIRGSARERYSDSLDAIQRVSFGVFVPMYFILVGSRLQFDAGFSPALLVLFLLGSSLLRLASVGLAGKLAGFGGLDVLNLAVACNARGGPGIVLATIAFEAGIINGAFFTALVLTAVVTSQFAGFWLWWVLRNGWPLLASEGAVVPVTRRWGALDEPSGAPREGSVRP